MGSIDVVAFLAGVLDSVYVVALTAWVGAILFFSFAVAPIVFRVLGEQIGGQFVRTSFPAIISGERLPGRSLYRRLWLDHSVFTSSADRWSGCRPW